MSGELVIQIVTVVVSVISALVSVRYAHQASRDAKLQQQMNLFSLNREYYADLQHWGDTCIEVVTEAIFLCDLDPAKMPSQEIFADWWRIRQRLSSLIDRGRLFFPNLPKENFGDHKLPAYRGFRPAELDPLVSVFTLLKSYEFNSWTANRDLRERCWHERQDFVSKLQALLNPVGRGQQLQNINNMTSRS